MGNAPPMTNPSVWDEAIAAATCSNVVDAINASVVNEDVVTARNATEQEHERLGLQPVQPVLVAWRRAFDQHGTGKALEITLRVINPALHQLVYRYT
jgi:DNA-binding GntR family transcriptional regulator